MKYEEETISFEVSSARRQLGHRSPFLYTFIFEAGETPQVHGMSRCMNLGTSLPHKTYLNNELARL